MIGIVSGSSYPCVSKTTLGARCSHTMSCACWVHWEGLVGALGAWQCKAHSQGLARKMLMVKKLPLKN